MCWEQKVATIVMMTRLEERARIKCDLYWPTRGSDTYGVVSVMITDIQELATYCVRTFQLHRLGIIQLSSFVTDCIIDCGVESVPVVMETLG